MNGIFKGNPQRRITDESTWCYMKHIFELYTSKSKSILVSLIILSTYLLWFTVGLFFGDFFSNTSLYSFDITDVSRVAALVTVFSVGSIAVYNSIFKHHPLIILGIILIVIGFLLLGGCKFINMIF